MPSGRSRLLLGGLLLVLVVVSLLLVRGSGSAAGDREGAVAATVATPSGPDAGEAPRRAEAAPEAALEAPPAPGSAPRASEPPEDFLVVRCIRQTDGSPVAEAMVRLATSGQDAFALRWGGDDLEQGLRHVPASWPRARADDSGVARLPGPVAEQTLVVAASVDAVGVVVVPAGAREVELVMRPRRDTALLRGRLLDVAGEPLRDARFRVEQVRTDERGWRFTKGRTEITDGEGRFAFSTLVSDAEGTRHVLRFRYRPEDGGVAEWTAEVPLPPPFPTEGGDLGVVRLGLAEVLALVRVLDDQGRPLPGATVRLVERQDLGGMGSAESSQPMGETDERGELAILHRAEDGTTHAVRVRADGFVSQERVLDPGTTVTLRLTREATFHGRLVLDPEVPPAALVVRASTPDGRQVGAVTPDDEGAFVLTGLAPGPVALAVVPKHPVVADEELFRLDGVRIGVDGVDEPLTLDLRGRLRTLVLHVVDEKGKPLTDWAYAPVGEPRRRGGLPSPTTFVTAGDGFRFWVGRIGQRAVLVESSGGEETVALPAALRARVHLESWPPPPEGFTWHLFWRDDDLTEVDPGLRTFGVVTGQPLRPGRAEVFLFQRPGPRRAFAFLERVDADASGIVVGDDESREVALVGGGRFEVADVPGVQTVVLTPDPDALAAALAWARR